MAANRKNAEETLAWGFLIGYMAAIGGGIMGSIALAIAGSGCMLGTAALIFVSAYESKA